MKSAILATAVLASAAIAQPHNHHRRHQHEKRDLVVEWVTEELTVTVMVDDATTETFYPSTTQEVVATSSGSPGQFYQAAGVSTSLSVAAPSTTLVAKPSTDKTVAPVEPTTTSTSTSTSTSSTPVVVPTTTSTTPVAVPTTTSTTSVAVPTTISTTPVAVPTTTTQAPVVEPSSTYVAPVASTTAASSGGSGSGSGTQYSSDMTYYQIGLGSCGYDDSGLDLSKPVVAVDSKLWDSISTATSFGIDQPAHPFCNQEITIKYNGKTTTGVVRDRCGGCVEDAIDVSQVIFEDLVGGTSEGRVDVEWSWNSGKW